MRDEDEAERKISDIERVQTKLRDNIAQSEQLAARADALLSSSRRMMGGGGQAQA